MKLTVLVDNNTYIDHYYLGEPALCFYIEDEGLHLLFDTGYSDVFIRNARLLGIDLSLTDTIVFSHGHNDHTRGMTFFQQEFPAVTPRIIAHPDIFRKRYEDDMYIGTPFSQEDIKNKYRLTVSKEPVRITKNLTFLGEIPDYFDFEKRKPIGTIKEKSNEYPDYVMDDTALAYHTEEGLFIITGCSHSGICNIIQHAKNACNEERILGVIGGFHLFEITDQLTHTINYFVDNKIEKLHPCHCVSFKAKVEIHKQIPIEEVGVGLSINL